MSHPAQLPIHEIQKALGEDNPISRFYIQNPSDGTSPTDSPVRITFSSRKFVDVVGEGVNVADAAENLISNINEEVNRCSCGCRRSQCRN